MRIIVRRQDYSDTCTMGKLYIDGLFVCHTLEDRIRPQGVKVYGDTAIPEGTYDVILDYSQKFKRDMPHILNVPGFDGIRIHNGNFSSQTQGCILVGLVKGDNCLERSRDAYQMIYEKLKTAPADITITIE